MGTLPMNTPCRIGGPQIGEKIKKGFIASAVLGTHMWANCLHNGILGVPEVHMIPKDAT